MKTPPFIEEIATEFMEAYNWEAFFSLRGKEEVKNKLRTALSEAYAQGREERDREVVEMVEGMGKKELRSPRSFGDNEQTVDVSSGYNQALQDILTQLQPNK